MNATHWTVVPGNLVTRWAEDVTPEEVLPEYPRPQMVRPRWLNLNGLWDHTVVSRKWEMVTDFDGPILVPFPLESALSGVKGSLSPDERLWYRRTFTLPQDWQDERLLLHFGAVDWEAQVWVNDQNAGVHYGGYTPFTREISDFVQPGENELLVAVWDPTDTHWQQRGKQVLEPGGMWYTPVSGIWQTVWLEPVPETFIRGLSLRPDIDAGHLVLDVHLDGDAAGLGVEASILDQGLERATQAAPAGQTLTLSLPDAKLWSPDNPHLYDLVIQLRSGSEVVDRVTSYFAMRAFTVEPDEQGVPRLCLNHEPYFFYGPLDQGYWPDGLYTAPTDEALRHDVALCKEMGCTLIRKHVKIEPARWYYHCDQLGLVVWQDMPNGGKFIGNAASFLAVYFGLNRRDDRRYGRHGRGQEVSRQDYWSELRAMIAYLGNAPCIGMWVPFNEGWGQFDAAAVALEVQRIDPSRPVDHASGWFDQGGGDIKSRHVYFKKVRYPRGAAGRATAITEFGGYSVQVDGHLWDPEKKYGYKWFESTEALTAAYIELIETQIKPLIARGLSAAVYTQLSDVETEVNGWVTYDRQVVKVDKELVGDLHRSLARSQQPGSYGPQPVNRAPAPSRPPAEG